MTTHLNPRSLCGGDGSPPAHGHWCPTWTGSVVVTRFCRSGEVTRPPRRADRSPVVEERYGAVPRGARDSTWWATHMRCKRRTTRLDYGLPEDSPGGPASRGLSSPARPVTRIGIPTLRSAPAPSCSVLSLWGGRQIRPESIGFRLGRQEPATPGPGRWNREGESPNLSVRIERCSLSFSAQRTSAGCSRRTRRLGRGAWSPEPGARSR